jgi:hypothetical protein
MDLFELDENDYTVKLNRVWLWLIPEFADILRKDKGSTGDKGGHRKLWARKRFAYIYFYIDFKSPIYSWEEDQKKEESLRYTGLDKDAIKQDYMVAAILMYKELQIKAARSLRTLEAVNTGLTALNEYFENIDFTKTDKQGKLLYSPTDYVKNISTLNKAYDELGAFERRVMAELTKSGGIRGSATKGDREMSKESNTGKSDSAFEEGSDTTAEGPDWLDLSTGTQFKDTL